jgi:hypothetical protein
LASTIHLKRHRVEAERAAIVSWLAANPTAGDLIVGSGGAQKLRWKAKGNKANLTMAERNQLRAPLSALATEYRKGGKRRVQSR